MKILHIISTMKRGGSERQLSLIVNYDQKNENHILYFYKNAKDYVSQYDLGSKSTYCSHKNNIKRLCYSYKTAKALDIDIIVTWGTMESIFGKITAILIGIPLINFSIRHGIRSKRFSHYFRTLVLHLSRNVVANSRAGLRANNLKRGHVLYNGIEPVAVSEVDKQEAERAMFKGECSKALRLISVANLVPYKDYFTVFSALKELKEEGYEFRYHIIGEGPLRSQYEEYLKQTQLDGCVFLLGRITNPYAYLANADIFIHSSKGEGCSNAILEAMYMRLPIIATDTGGTSEIVEDNAFLFQYQDYKSLKKSILILFNDIELRNGMAKRSKEICMERFTLERMLSDYDNILKKVLQK